MATKRQLKTGIGRFMELVTERQQSIHTEIFNLHRGHIATRVRVTEQMELHAQLESIQNGLRTILSDLGGRKVKPTVSWQAIKLGPEIQRYIAHLYIKQSEGSGEHAWDLLDAWRFIGSQLAVKQTKNVGLAIFKPKPGVTATAGCSQEYGDDLEAMMEVIEDPAPDNVSPIA